MVMNAKVRSAIKPVINYVIGIAAMIGFYYAFNHCMFEEVEKPVPRVEVVNKEYPKGYATSRPSELGLRRDLGDKLADKK
ncbi:hypothetical protein HOA55_01270 [archaeon]|jgi:hypothetical protein|nr:hypothetical protein [archaeon]MBT3578063.1 hypothetical protein [archaeon]MBT6819964.1 hypothetical protein [archaeon]MBT6956324.1 hypothetical protein [archaeon]MBT7025001.1 hypothetical protein [archaeon]